MPLTLRPDVVAEIIRRVLDGRDHRDVVVDMIDAIFVSDVLDFFEQVVKAKIRNEGITVDWYRSHFLNDQVDKDDFAMNGGLNMKTIGNKRGTQRKEIVIEESLEHHDRFLELVDSLTDDAVNIDLSLTLGKVTVHLDLNETLVVINALAVRRAAIRGGAWSTMGKRVEAPLMETLCRIFEVDSRYFTRALGEDRSLREVDYYLILPNGQRAKCEVKLMGRGNPESADAIHARDTDVFVASTLSDRNKRQLDSANVLWTQLQEPSGFMRFHGTLRRLGIPHVELREGVDYSTRINRAIQDTLGLGQLGTRN